LDEADERQPADAVALDVLVGCKKLPARYSGPDRGDALTSSLSVVARSPAESSMSLEIFSKNNVSGQTPSGRRFALLPYEWLAPLAGGVTYLEREANPMCEYSLHAVASRPDNWRDAYPNVHFQEDPRIWAEGERPWRFACSRERVGLLIKEVKLGSLNSWV